MLPWTLGSRHGVSFMLIVGRAVLFDCVPFFIYAVYTLINLIQFLRV